MYFKNRIHMVILSSHGILYILTKLRSYYMKKSFIALLIISVFTSFTLGFMIKQVLITNNAVYDYDAFYKYVDKVKNKFNVTGYTQILKDSDAVTTVPDSLYGRQDLDQGLYSRQKSFFFKNKDNGVVILLSISASKLDSVPAWTNSIGYTTSAYNQTEGRYKDTYSHTFSDSEIFAYNYVSDGVNVHLISIAKDSGDKIISLEEMVKFVEQLKKQL